jgi:hypothetical protein
MTEAATATTYPIPILDKIIGKPDFANTSTLLKQLGENARSVESLGGGGRHGFYYLLVTDAHYLQEAGVEYTPAVNPGPNPTRTGDTGIIMTEDNRVFDDRKQKFSKARRVERELKSQLLQAVEAIYLSELEDAMHGHANNTIQQLLAYIEAEYMEISPEDLEANLEALQAPWEPEETLLSLWKRTNHCRRVATKARDPITDSALIRKVVIIFENTGLFEQALRAWRMDYSTAQQTVANLKIHFTKANKERIRSMTSQRGGFHGANAANQTRTDNPTPVTTVLQNPSGYHYCWSHGLGTNKNHDSSTCSNKKDGHQDNATLQNRMNGSNLLLGGRRPTRTDSQRSTST